MPHYVYKLIFKKRREQGILPYLYIGSKSNALYENGIILDSRNKPYYGASCYPSYDGIVADDEIHVDILKEFQNYTDALNYESTIQKNLDVAASPEYFNLGIATVNNFTDPNFASYKHTITGKTVRLPRTHYRVLSGEYVGVSKGAVFSEHERRRRGRSGAENGFYGRTHTYSTIEKMLATRDTTYKNDPKRYEEVRNKLSDTAKNTFTGVPKTDEHKRKIGRKNLIMLKNKDTGESIRIPREEKLLYDDTIWKNPASISKNHSQTGSRWVTNGTDNIKLQKNQDTPDGFWNGRTIHWKNKKGK